MMPKFDAFFKARLRLTAYYSLTVILILGGSSFLLYNAILHNLYQSIAERVNDPVVARLIADKVQDKLLSQFLTIDLALILLILLLGFFLTHETLEPIKKNMEKQKRFIADASHELRTPIAVIMSGLEVNLSNKNLDLPHAKKTLESTLEEMREFSKLSNNLLDMSRQDAQRETKFETLDPKKIVQNIVEKTQNFAFAKRIEIVTKLYSSAKIKGNKTELERVFYNILDNAIKYTNENGNITIEDKIDSNKYIVKIADTGVGIEKNFLEKIFDPFVREDSSRTTSGAGLGLTLARNIILNHNGTIDIESQKNKGTSVSITLPLSSH